MRYGSFSLRFSTNNQLGLSNYCVLGIVIFFSFYFGLGTYAFENMNEGLYAEIPREMLAAGKFIIPTLNYVPYIEKPPLLYWCIALCYKLFGVSELSARLVPATFATLTCLSLVHFGQLLRLKREGWLSALVLSTSIGFFCLARVLLFDIVLTFFLTSSLLSFYIWFNLNQKKYLRYYFLFLGLAFLTKGLLAVILVPFISLAFLLSEPRGYLKIPKLFDALGISLLLMLVVPWTYLAIKQLPHFAFDFFINEQLFRFFQLRIPHDYHTGPFYFYLPRIPLYLFPWSLLVFFLKHKNPHVPNSLKRFLWLWFLIPLIFFSLSSSKSSYYMILVAPALALLIGSRINSTLSVRQNKVFLYTFLLLGFILVAGFGLVYAATKGLPYFNFLPSFFSLDSVLSDTLFWMAIVCACTYLLGIVVCFFKQSSLLHFYLILSLMLPLFMFYSLDKQKLTTKHSEFNIAKYIETHDKDRPLYLYQDYEKVSSILFYVNRRLPIIESQSSDLYYGMHHTETKSWFYTLGDFLKDNSSHHYVVVRKSKFLDFLHAASPKHYCIVSQSGGAVLLSDDPQECQF